VRAMLGNIGVLVLPGQVSVPKAHEAFDEGGRLKRNAPRNRSPPWRKASWRRCAN